MRWRAWGSTPGVDRTRRRTHLSRPPPPFVFLDFFLLKRSRSLQTHPSTTHRRLEEYHSTTYGFFGAKNHRPPVLRTSEPADCGPPKLFHKILSNNFTFRQYQKRYAKAVHEAVSSNQMRSSLRVRRSVRHVDNVSSGGLP